MKLLLGANFVRPQPPPLFPESLTPTLTGNSTRSHPRLRMTATHACHTILVLRTDNRSEVMAWALLKKFTSWESAMTDWTD